MVRLFKNFWAFHTAYWLFVGSILFIYGLTYGHWEIALIRNIYTPMIGFGASLLMVKIYKSRSDNPIGLVIFLSLTGAVISSMLVNPVTYGLLGYELKTLTFTNLFQDFLYFVLFYTVWGLLYLQRHEDINPEEGSEPLKNQTAFEMINVTKGNKILKLDPHNILYIQANGDYVEFFTQSDAYLKQGSISHYEDILKAGAFIRIHRSIIVNAKKIQSISGPTKGQFWIKLGVGHEVRSSRNYQKTVEKLVPQAL